MTSLMTSSAYVFTHFILYLCYFWTDWDHSYTKMTGLISTFQKKNCFMSWRHWWRHKRHLWRHIGFKTWKRHNFVVFQSIWTIDTPKSRYWNELFKKLKKICNNHRYILYDVISIISDYRIFIKQRRRFMTS